jgi:hypothetical protein
MAIFLKAGMWAKLAHGLRGYFDLDAYIRTFIPSSELTQDELDSIQHANTPSESNPMATIADIPTDELTADELEAIQGANNPSSSNPMATMDDIVSETGFPRHKDSFGVLGTSLVGVTTWTNRALRSTKMVVPHIAKGDVFSYRAQLNHDKELNTNLDGFHLHIIPVGTIDAPAVIALDYSYVWLNNGDTYPSTFPHSSTAYINLATNNQYNYLIKTIVSDIPHPEKETYSSEFFIECTRRNDAQDTYAGEFALVDGDVHYITNQHGSVYEFSDTTTTTTTVAP